MHSLKFNLFLTSMEHLRMAMLTIRNLEDDVKKRLRRRAAKHGCSMEEEARQILRQALSGKTPEKGLASRIHQRVMDTTGGLELELPARSQPRPAPDFSGNSV
jgi:plasmid stability protein